MRAQRENRVKASFGGKAPLCTSFRVYAKAGRIPTLCLVAKLSTDRRALRALRREFLGMLHFVCCLILLRGL
jgi:hypothetical protein